MNEITGLVISAVVALGGLLYVTYDNLEYKGYERVNSCYGECYEEYIRVNGTFLEELEAKRVAASADEFSSIKGLWAGCAACHGTDGKGIAAFPALAGRSADYISTALLQYRNGETRGAQSVLMWGQAGNLTDQQIQTLSKYVEVELSE